jgi:hypothetical protein
MAFSNDANRNGSIAQIQSTAESATSWRELSTAHRKFVPSIIAGTRWEDATKHGTIL